MPLKKKMVLTFTSKVPRLRLQMSTLHLLLNFLSRPQVMTGPVSLSIIWRTRTSQTKWCHTLSGLMPRVIKVLFNGVVWLRKMAMIAREKFYTPTQLKRGGGEEESESQSRGKNMIKTHE
jgi:hypothetical protein